MPGKFYPFCLSDCPRNSLFAVYSGLWSWNFSSAEVGKKVTTPILTPEDILIL